MGELAIAKHFLEPGALHFAPTPTLVCVVLGSSVAVSIWDRRRGRGGMHHFIRPEPEPNEPASARHGQAGISALVRIFRDDGSRRPDLEAQIFGGGRPTGKTFSAAGLGERNIRIARRILRRWGIKISSEDVGGTLGRKVVFNSETNEAMSIKVDAIRESDWFPE